jgi:hypothetical protein
MRTKRRTINLILLILLAATVLVSRAFGQTDELDKLREYIQQNEELLLEAESLVRGTNSAKARASLEAARQLHEESLKQFESARPVISAQTARQARNAILKAIQLAKREAKLEERALNSIEQARRRNEMARTLFDEAGSNANDLAKKLIDESMNQLMRARESMHEHMFEIAIQSANASIGMSNRAIRMIKRDVVGPEIVRREIGRTDRLLDRVDERAHALNNAELSRVIAEAHELQNRARANAAESRYMLAVENTKRARALARQVISRTGGSPESMVEAVARALDLTDGLIEQAYEIVQENGDDRATSRLDEARRIQRTARQAYDSGQYARASTLTQRAREIARDTMRTIDRSIDGESARLALVRTDEVIARLKAALDSNGGTTASELHERAVVRQRAAWDAFNSNDLKKALANTKVARNLANRAIQQLENE